VEIAYDALMDIAPMLANPSEYRTMMYEAFWEGKEPKPRKPGQGEKPATPRSSGPPPRSAMAELEAERRRILALQAAKQVPE
jgi:hypothetical protein